MPDRLSRRRVLQTSAVALTTAVAGCASDSDDPADVDADEVVTVGPENDFSFSPETVEIDAGQSVGWTWDSNNHNVNPTSIPDDADWEGEPDLSNEGHTYEHTFDVPGTYEYQCDPHAASGMAGTVVVSE